MLAKKKLRTGSCEIALFRLRANSALSGFMKHPLGVPSAYLREVHQYNTLDEKNVSQFMKVRRETNSELRAAGSPIPRPISQQSGIKYFSHSLSRGSSGSKSTAY